MKKVILDTVWLLVIAHLLTNLNCLLAWIWPWMDYKTVDWFLSPSYHLQMVITWYVKFATTDLMWIVVFYVLAKIAYSYSPRLFLVSVIFFCYHCIDAFLFWWNFRKSHYIYFVMLWAASFSIFSIVYPFTHEKIAKIKSLF